MFKFQTKPCSLQGFFLPAINIAMTQPLTAVELTSLKTDRVMGSHYYWGRCIALSANPTEQQIETAREYLALPYYNKSKVYIWEDKLRPRPVVTLIQVGKATRNRALR